MKYALILSILAHLLIGNMALGGKREEITNKQKAIDYLSKSVEVKPKTLVRIVEAKKKGLIK